MSEATIIRLGIIGAGVLLMVLIFWLGRPGAKSKATRRGPHSRDPGLHDDAAYSTNGNANAAHPAQQMQSSPANEMVSGNNANLDSGTGTGTETDSEWQTETEVGRRHTERMDKVVKLYVAARAGHLFDGSDVVVAAEKIGMVFGYGKAFHRLVERKPALDPIYTVANVQNQGSLDINTITDLQTPAIAFYLMLPAPIPALEAFDMMLPAAKRATELLNGVLLDDQQNVVSRQTVAHIREELRQYDRAHEISETNAGKSPRQS